MKLKKILLLDDDNFTNHISKHVIEKLELTEELIIQTDAKEALAYLREECKLSNSYPDLILLDLKMPETDGFEFLEKFEDACRGLREEIVVVILTASHDAEDVIKLRKLGNYFLVHKPLSIEKLIDICHRYFRNRDLNLN